MEVQQTRAIRRHGARPSKLGEVTPNANPFSRHRKAMAIGSPISQQAALVHVDPVPRWLDTYIAGFGLHIQRKTMIGGNHHLMEPLLFELVNREADALERLVN